VAVVISDSGIGIAIEDQQAVFERFRRLDDFGEHTPGACIGLPLVKELIDSLEGTIELKSMPGEGTSFTVALQRVGNLVPQSKAIGENTISDSAALELESLIQSVFLLQHTSPVVSKRNSVYRHRNICSTAVTERLRPVTPTVPEAVWSRPCPIPHFFIRCLILGADRA
jgi:hypothetical protein